MPSDLSVLERQMAEVELRPFTLDEFHRRRHRKQRNRRIATAVMGVVLVAVVTGGVLRAVESDPDDDQTITAGPGIEQPSPFVGTWESTDTDGPSQTMEIQRSGGEDTYEILVRYDAAAACSGAPATMTGSGRREIGTGWRPGLAELVVAAEVTCDDSSTPSFERGQREALASVRFFQDPVTGELIGPTADPDLFDAVDEHSFEVAWRRPGSEPDQGDPSRTIDRLVDAVNTGDSDAFISVFAPDGAFDTRERFATITLYAPLRVPAPEVAAWMAVQEAWGFEANVRTCRSVPSPPLPPERRFSASSDTWIECDVAARWTRLSLEITDQWRFELRGARLVGWYADVLDLDPADRVLPLGYPGLEAWEAWLETNHPEDAARLLNPRRRPSFADGCEGEDDMPCGYAERSWVIEGHRFTPTNLIPYNPAFADEIDASIREYLSA